MRIGIDIDGVLSNIEKFQLEYGSKYFYEKYNVQIFDAKAYYSKDVFGVSQDNDVDFWKTYFRKYMSENNPRTFVSEIIDKLKDEGNEIYIITARLDDCDNFDISVDEMQNITKEWFKKNNIYYDKIIWSNGSKVPYCIDNNIDIMIEDNGINIKEISSVIPVLCFDNKYNEEICGPNITRVYSWYDIYAKLHDFKK